ncbi:TonB-dependent receptor [Emcibacter nanhaiensis]|uniref:TonB-dependent receptor n=1 Tax=Emcibacter nanhaiensis TaxID=1505037 RepID=A0A501PBU1_9PROT|nr:TonB-dependent receptor [Emcibacter nanhaiensis]TPD57695.1 TonB-dependent receptor [Emcibacter nanhaiensis]
MPTTRKRSVEHCKIALLMSAVIAATACPPLYARTIDDVDDETAYEEIVVTSQKRAQSLSDVPISISAFNADNIQQSGINQLREISDFIPNMLITANNDFNSQITIRGVGANSRNIGFDTRVGVYLDGVYLGQSPAINQELIDLERVEVLRGPQGTLFGKNNVAGALLLVSKAPADTLQGRVGGNVGSLGTVEVDGNISIPLSDRVRTKFSLLRQTRDGTLLNILDGKKLNDRDSYAYRAQLAVDLSDNLDVNFSFDGLNSDHLAFLGENLSDSLGLTVDPNAPEDREVSFNIDPLEKRDLYGGNMTVNYRFAGDYALKSITAYRDNDVHYRNDTDYSPLDLVYIDYFDHYKQFTQEFQLISPDLGSLRYVAGLYYYHQKADTNRIVTNGAHSFFLGNVPGTTVTNDGTVTTNSYAAYADFDIDLADRLTLNVGGRYTYEKKDVDWSLNGDNSGIFMIATNSLVDDRSDDYLSTRASLSYEVSDQLNVYASYGSGFKSGGYNLDYVRAPDFMEGLEYGKETVQSFELGLKGALLDNRLIVNLSAFLANYDDYQVNQFIDIGGGFTSISIRNAAKVETKGLEAELTWRPVDGLELQGAAGLLDASFDAFPGGGAQGGDVSGNDLIRAPEFTFAASAQYEIPLSPIDARLLLRAEVTHASSFYTTEDNVSTATLADMSVVPFGQVEALTLVNARAGLLSDNESWEIYVWARNLFNEKQAIDYFRDFFGTIVSTPNDPRIYGVELVWNF